MKAGWLVTLTNYRDADAPDHGRSYLIPSLRAEDWVAAKARARQFSKELTKRQRDFVQLFAEGRPLKEIAALLDLSEKTVEFHKHHIMVSFNLKSNADLVLFGLKHGLIAVDPEARQQSLQPRDFPSSETPHIA